jgi:hypothetical protein
MQLNHLALGSYALTTALPFLSHVPGALCVLLVSIWDGIAVHMVDWRKATLPLGKASTIWLYLILLC